MYSLLSTSAADLFLAVAIPLIVCVAGFVAVVGVITRDDGKPR